MGNEYSTKTSKRRMNTRTWPNHLATKLYLWWGGGMEVISFLCMVDLLFKLLILLKLHLRFWNGNLCEHFSDSAVQSPIHWNILWTFDCAVDFPRVLVVYMWGRGAAFRVYIFWRPAGRTGIRRESTSQPSVRSGFRCRRLNCEVNEVLTMASISGAQLELQKYSDIAQKAYNGQQQNSREICSRLRQFRLRGQRVCFDTLAWGKTIFHKIWVFRQ